MKRTAVVGLGIIGASTARALKKAGFPVDGFDLHSETLEYALQMGYIDGVADDLTAYDAVFLAIPPKAAISLLETANFAHGAFVTDLCGVKSCIEKAVYANKRGYRYIGLHPMAGKETSGIKSSSATLFTFMMRLWVALAMNTYCLVKRNLGLQAVLKCKKKRLHALLLKNILH